MPTLSGGEDAPQTTVERVRRALTDPIERMPPVLAALAVAAGAGSTAPDPFGVIVAAVMVPAAWYVAKRR